MAKRRKKTASAKSVGAGKDYVKIAVAYATEAANAKNKGKFCKWTRLAAKRFLEDLKRAKKKGAPFYFDPWHATDACTFIELLPHVEGTWDSPTIVLHPSHVFFVVNLFGFRRPNGMRRFTTALYAVARKNAKSTLAAAILLYCLVAEGEIGPQVITAATTAEQARIVFGIARRMVVATPDLRAQFEVEPFEHAVACYSNGGTFKPINAKASTQDGLNPSAVGFDELHAHKTHDLMNVLTSAAGARRNPLFLYTTTEGYMTPGPWPEEKRFAQQVLEGVLEADHYLAVIYALDEKDPDFKEQYWVKANPLIDVNPELIVGLRKMALEAKAKPGVLAEFRIKKLNRPASSATGWVDLVRWNRCNKPVDLDKLEGLPCWMAFDLAATTDMCALRALWLDGDMYLTAGWRWVPESAVAYRTVRNTVPYAGWVQVGLVEQTPGEVTDYDVIEKRIRELAARFKPKVIAFDPWNATQLVNRMLEDELPLAKFIQGPKSFHPAMQLFERAYRAGKLAHGGDPVLRWSASNLVVRHDENRNIAPSKKRSADKIDDVVALVMAFGATMMQAESGPSIYETRGLRRV